MKTAYAAITAAFIGQAVAAPQGFLGGLVSGVVNSGYGRVPDVPGAAPRKVVLANRTPQVKEGKSMKIRYGPYKVPNMSKKSIVGESGVLYNYPDLKIEKPCEECILLGINAGLEYPNGSDANVGTGMWLHHMVAFTVGQGRMDPTCVGKTSLPHMVVGSDASKSERFFSSGNERSPARFNPPWVTDETLGYFLNPTDKFAFIIDLMNQNMDDRVVYVTMTYDYVDGRPKGINNVKSLWLDAAQCGTSEVPPPVQSGNYSVKYKWTANIEGDILGAGGHLHDGGTHLTLKVDGKQICDSVAQYGAGGKPMGGGGAMGGMGGVAQTPSNAPAAKAQPTAPVEHITAMSGCFGDTLGIKRLQKGQVWELEGFYDYDKHPGMKHDSGKQENVMGIAMMFIKNPKV